MPQQRWLLSIAGARPLVLRANDLATLVHAARAGIGVAALPCFIGDADPGLVRIEADHAGAAGREIWIAIHEDLRRSPRVRSAFEGIAEIFWRDRRLLEGTGVP